MKFYQKPTSYTHALDMWVASQEAPYGYKGNPPPEGHENPGIKEVLYDNKPVKKGK